MFPHARKLFLVLVAATALGGFTVYHHIIGDTPEGPLAGPTPVSINARVLPLLENDHNVFIAGSLRYVAGWALTSDDPHFGGFSGLVVTPDSHLVAISDRGDWLNAKLDLGGGVPLTDGVMRPFSKEARKRGKASYDAESVIAYRDGYLVSFEFNHRFEYVKPDGSNRISPLTGLVDFSGVSDNSGVEAITLVGENLFALPERGVDTTGRLHGWLISEGGAEDIYFRPPVNYSPTDAATMKNGDVLVLLRRYSPLDGVSAKLVRIRAANIRPGATLEGEELLHLDPPYTVDNMEGLDVTERDGEAPLIVMMSDDNFRKSQRTLLLVFRLEKP